MEQEPLLEICYYPTLARASGIRVYPGGLYHYHNHTQPWQEVWTFTEEEMNELREAIASSNFFDLPAEIRPEQDVCDGTLAVWTITSAGRKHQVRLLPGANEPNLDVLFTIFTRLRKHTPERSEWIIRLLDGTRRKIRILGSANAFPELHELMAVLFRTGIRELDFPSRPQNALVRIKWYTATGIQENVFYENGLHTRCCDGGKEEASFHTIEQIREIKASIARIDWDHLPAQIDTTHG